MAKTKNSAKAKPKAKQDKFDEKKLILNKWIVSLFDVKDFNEISKEIKKKQELEQVDEGESRFCKSLCLHLEFPSGKLSHELLHQYDANIVTHTERIAHKRQENLRWKYFQYLTLLFTEIYLDRFFRDAEGLLTDLNAFLVDYNADKAKKDQIEAYKKEDLNKLAFWSATGSGKTLIMHIHILQYQHYLKEHGKMRDINQVLLITPNEGLSEQHKKEFDRSGIPNQRYEKMNQFMVPTGFTVQILEVYKLKDSAKEKTVDVASFESNNLVLVDEGHRGSSGKEWKEKRDQLSELGFAFEYSATFGQAVSSASGTTKKELAHEYAKCILFDYSYKFFYKDGFGKEYNILNLPDKDNEEVVFRYLVACLLVFYQQLKIFADKKSDFVPFNIHKPLWVFVGKSVTGKGSNQEVTDVVQILEFYSRFASDKANCVDILEQLLQGNLGMVDEKNRDIFQRAYPHIQGLDAEETYHNILLELFNSENHSKKLTIDHLKGEGGELGLRLGNHEYFGVVNVGDTTKLFKMCENNDKFYTDEKNFTESLFGGIDHNSSKINVLIGARKFSEGWNSWRVSTMGLLNVGRSEGSEIIQLFGRGVRLKGHNMTLKRSRRLDRLTVEPPQNLNLAETLNVFGIRADYMKNFKDYLDEEGLSNEVEKLRVSMPIIRKHKLLAEDQLKVPDLPLGFEFKKNGPVPTLQYEKFFDGKIEVNWFPKIQAKQGADITEKRTAEEQEIAWTPRQITDDHIIFLDYDELFFDLQEFKNLKSWFNLKLDREHIRKLIEKRNVWGKVFIPADQLEIINFGRIKQVQKIISTTLRAYCEKYYERQKKLWDTKNMKYAEVKDYLDKKKIATPESEYLFEAELHEQEIIDELEEIKEAIEQGKLEEIRLKHERGQYRDIAPVIFDRHLYYPLIYFKSGKEISVSPVALEPSEYEFLEDLMAYLKIHDTQLKDKRLYLLRNASRGKGIGFTPDGGDGFYPDFILWIITEDKQFINFIEPHGLEHTKSLNDPKIQFYLQIKDIEAQIGDPNIALNSFVVTPSKYDRLRDWGSKEKLERQDFRDAHVYFQKDDKDSYVSEIFEDIGG